MVHAPCALLLFDGPSHVVVKVSAVAIQRLGADPVGMPAREVYIGTHHTATLLAMDRVYATGEVLEVIEPEARVLIAPRWRVGRIVGVGAHWTPDRPRTPEAPRSADHQPVGAG